MKKRLRDLLLVIDMQNIYTRGQEWECLDTEGVAERICRLIGSDSCDEVLFSQYIAAEHPQGVWADYNRKYEKINADRWANEEVAPLKAYAKKYPCYSKSVYSSLAIPEVMEAAKKADRVIVSGVVAECCVLSTVLALIDAGIYTIYLTDGVSGLDRPKEEATELILSGLSPLHLDLLTVDEYIKDRQRTKIE